MATKKQHDPFYDKENIAYLEKIMSDVKSGKAHFAEHELQTKEKTSITKKKK